MDNDNRIMVYIRENTIQKELVYLLFIKFFSLGRTKDKLEDMDVSLIKEGVRLVAIIFRTCLQPNRWTYITSLGTK